MTMHEQVPHLSTGGFSDEAEPVPAAATGGGATGGGAACSWLQEGEVHHSVCCPDVDHYQWREEPDSYSVLQEQICGSPR